MAMDIKDLTVLVAEDHDLQRRLAVGVLKRLGTERVIEARHGGDALTALRSASNVDVVLCDLDMPGMDGVEFIRRVAEERLAPAIVIVSALEPSIVDSVERMSRAHGHIVLGTVEKPITAQKLRNVLANLGDRSERRREAARTYTAAEIEAAFAAKQFEAWFQPKVRMSDQHVAGVEALLRWRHPTDGIVLPGAFLHDAQLAGLSESINWFMIDAALTASAAWQAHNIAIPVSVNMSLRFLEDLGIADRLTSRSSDMKVEPRNVIVEVTEGLAATNFVHVMENLARLRIRGFGVSIDDYGTGYSSVQQLARIPYTELKLDNSFVIGAAHKPTQRAILESALDLARRMKLTSVAEGVEREEEWALLKSLGCDLAQGYYIAPPMPAAEFPAWHHDWTGSLGTKD